MIHNAWIHLFTGIKVTLQEIYWSGPVSRKANNGGPLQKKKKKRKEKYAS